MSKERFFSLTGEDVTFELDEPFTKKGNASDVFLIEDGNTVFKRYIDDESKPLYWRISYEVFEFLKACDSINLIRLRETFYRKDCSRLFDKKRTIRNPSKRIINAYTYDFVPSMDGRLIDMPVEYLLEGLHNLENLAGYFASHKLMMDDLNTNNIIFSENAMVMMDPDLYEFYPYLSEEGILEINKINLLKLFKKIIIEERNKHDIGLEVLFDGVDHKQEIASQVSKRLVNCKVVKDFSRKS